MWSEKAATESKLIVFSYADIVLAVCEPYTYGKRRTPARAFTQPTNNEIFIGFKQSKPGPFGFLSQVLGIF